MADDLPILKGDEARDIDLDVTQRLGRVRVLEAVATRVADTLAYHLGLDRAASKLLFVAGKGNNGANAIAAARMLHLRGWDVTLVPLFEVTPPDGNMEARAAMRENIREQLDLFESFVGADRIGDLDGISKHEGILVDGILGTGIDRPPRGVSGEAIELINQSSHKGVLSIDVPSGLNHITGMAPGACVRATWTINLHMLKSGQLEPTAKEFVGELWSAESALGFGTFPEEIATKMSSFYASAPIRKVFP